MSSELKQIIRNSGLVEMIENMDKQSAKAALNECVRLGIDAVAVPLGNELFSVVKDNYPALKLIAIIDAKPEEIIAASLQKADAVLINKVDETLLKQCEEFGLSCYSLRSNDFGCPVLPITCDTQLLKNEEIDAIIYEWQADKLSDIVDQLLGMRMVHIGINHENEEDALKAAKLFELFFHMPYKVGNSSVFSGAKELELMKTMGRGKNGHIAIGVCDIDRGMHYLEKRGCTFLQESLVCKDGKKIAIYLKDEISGFAVHLVKA